MVLQHNYYKITYIPYYLFSMLILLCLNITYIAVIKILYKLYIVYNNHSLYANRYIAKDVCYLIQVISRVFHWISYIMA